MSDTGKDEVTGLIHGLERINQIIDLCIDRELYEYVEDILRLGKNCSQYITELCNTDGKKSLEEFDFSKIKFPVLKIITPSNTETAKFFQSSELFKSETPPFDLNKKGKSFSLLKHWSDLLWAKRVRAELQKHNRGEWLDRYEDITLFLESRMPTCKPKGAINKDFYATKFSYLMELSAVAQGEASLGYAERARKLLKLLFSDYDDPKRGPYDRWIWWNMGMAYQHMVGRNQKAVLEFNRVIKEYFGKNSASNEKENIILENGSNALEFLLNILPATLQRAAINLKQQLGYHALQTLADSDFLLENFSPNYANTIYSASVSNLRQHINFVRLDAYQQLGSARKAEYLLKKIYKEVFKDELDIKKPSLPPIGVEKSSVVRTKLVEHLVTRFLERSKRGESYEKLISDIQKFFEYPGVRPTKDIMDKIKKLAGKIKKSADYLRKSIEIVTVPYWDWVEGNPFDERIYFSRWAQFLKRGINSSCKLNRIKPPSTPNAEIERILQKLRKVSEELLNATMDLYRCHRESLPIIQSERGEKKNLALENFRSDDLPDFVDGLKSFYKNMSILLSEERAIPPTGFMCSREESIKLLRDDHLQLLAAQDEFHEQFGENQQIHALKRCNERLIWPRVNGKADPEKSCTNCFLEKNDSSESFDGLLSCQKKIPRDDEKLPFEERNRFDLLCQDYETIMQETEDHLAEHLERRSLHSPPKKALHFIGLQRWNSLTPAQGKSVGGGYFIYQTDSDGEVELGIAIDPGFDYVRNLFRMGFSLMDVDIVLISHAHPDHLWDFESMVQLLHELEEKTDKIHQLNVVLTLGSYKRLSHIINNPELRRFINPLVIDIRKEIQPDFFKNLAPTKKNNTQNLLDYCFSFSPEIKKQKIVEWQPVLPMHKKIGKNREIEIWPTRAYHDDYSERSDSFGFLRKV